MSEPKQIKGWESESAGGGYLHWTCGVGIDGGPGASLRLCRQPGGPPFYEVELMDKHGKIYQLGRTRDVEEGKARAAAELWKRCEVRIRGYYTPNNVGLEERSPTQDRDAIAGLVYLAEAIFPDSSPEARLRRDGVCWVVGLVVQPGRTFQETGDSVPHAVGLVVKGLAGDIAKVRERVAAVDAALEFLRLGQAEAYTGQDGHFYIAHPNGIGEQRVCSVPGARLRVQPGQAAPSCPECLTRARS